MEQIRSRGVTIICVLIILVCLWSILGSIKGGWEVSEDVIKRFQPLPNIVIVPLFYMEKMLPLIGLIAAIGILFLKDIFRKGILFTSAFNVILYILESPLLFRNIPNTINEQFTRISSTNSDISQPVFFSIALMIVIAYVIIDCGFSVGVIYFFTRPKVKEQFK